ncbi:MAG TPA: DUF3568 family protein, partial [Smithellaceae bacterium]|nr:DUF3568 family protein [Smithellaceae bacterium]
ATSIVAGCAAVGAGAGTYLYVNGVMKTDYAASFEQVWKATEKTIADLRGIEVRPDRELARGTVSALINDEKVSFDITYKDKNLTTVGVRVGLFGNERSSQMLHDKIKQNIEGI